MTIERNELVERLRSVANVRASEHDRDGSVSIVPALLREAAAELERLSRPAPTDDEVAGLERWYAKLIADETIDGHPAIFNLARDAIDLCRRLQSAPAVAAGEAPVAWMAEDGERVCTAKSRQSDRVASRIFTIPLYAHPTAPSATHATLTPAPSPDIQPLNETKEARVDQEGKEGEK